MTTKENNGMSSEKKMIRPMDRCVCGHIVRDHTIRMKKGFFNSGVYTQCNLCYCEDVRAK